MNVKELIEKLNQMPPESEVLIQDHCNDCDIEEVIDLFLFERVLLSPYKKIRKED